MDEILRLIRESINLIDDTHGSDTEIYGKLCSLEAKISNDIDPKWEPFAMRMLELTLSYLDSVHQDGTEFYEELDAYLSNH